MNCRHCSSKLNLELIDLGSSPPSNAYLSAEALLAPEKAFPLRVMVEGEDESLVGELADTLADLAGQRLN